MNNNQDILVKIEHLTKFYGNKKAVKDLNLQVPRGEIFAFLGPNGAGKTTTIKIMTGLLRPDEGQVHICGFDVIQEPLKAKSHVSYVPDQPYLYDKLSGREFLYFVGEIFGLSKNECETRIQELAKYFETEEYIDQLTENYSHGMKQRIVISSALLHNPDVLIIDEPMVGLDPKSARLVKNSMRDLARKGTTIFMSTHVLSVAEEVADRIGIIHLGDLIALGTLNELKEKCQKEELLEGTETRSLEDLFLAMTENGNNNNSDKTKNVSGVTAE